MTKQRFRLFVTQREIRRRPGEERAAPRKEGCQFVAHIAGQVVANVKAAIQNPAIPCRDIVGAMSRKVAPEFWGGEMKQTWFEYYQERRAATQKNQQDNLTTEQGERYAQEARGEMQDLVQVRRREREKEAENGGFFEATEEEAMVDQAIKWPPGSVRHPFQRIADLSLKIAGRNPSLRYHLFKLLSEEAEKGTCAAAIYEAVWETINHLADDVLDEAIGVVYDQPVQESVVQAKAKAATAA